MWKHDLDTADWFLKVDYDTYLFVDNLKDYLRPLDPSKELYLGHNVYQHVHTGGPVFNQGGATVFAHATLDKMGRCVVSPAETGQGSGLPMPPIQAHPAGERSRLLE